MDEVTGLLTDRERRLLSGIVAGQRGPELAAAEGLHPSTIRNQLCLLYARIGVKDMTEAAVWWVRHRP